MARQSPLSKSLDVQNSPADPLTLVDGFHASPCTLSDSLAVNRAFRVGYPQDWQLSIQPDLPGGMVATATCLAVKGTHAQPGGRTPRWQGRCGPGLSALPAPVSRPFPPRSLDASRPGLSALPAPVSRPFPPRSLDASRPA
jgi:hypothetical protein